LSFSFPFALSFPFVLSVCPFLLHTQARQYVHDNIRQTKQHRQCISPSLPHVLLLTPIISYLIGFFCCLFCTLWSVSSLVSLSCLTLSYLALHCLVFVLPLCFVLFSFAQFRFLFCFVLRVSCLSFVLSYLEFLCSLLLVHPLWPPSAESRIPASSSVFRLLFVFVLSCDRLVWSCLVIGLSCFVLSCDDLVLSAAVVDEYGAAWMAQDEGRYNDALSLPLSRDVACSCRVIYRVL
jgi:hypothetical protein